jgi:hypothetical protein
MANGQNVQDQTAAKIAAIRGSLGANQPAPMPPISQPPVATDPTLTGIFSGIGPVMPTWPGANQSASVADPYQIASEDIGRQRAQAEKLVPLLARQDAMSRPQSPDNPEGIPKQGPGIDRGRGFGHNLGEVLLTIANMTGPGRAVNQAIYGPQKQAYARSSAEVAQQIQDIQKQEEIEQKPIGPMGELAYHQGLLGTREEQNRIREQLANERTKNDADRTDIERQKLELGRQKAEQAVQRWRQQYGMELKNFQARVENLDRETARDQMDAMLRDQANKNYGARTAAGQSEKEASLAAAADISQAKIDANNWLQRAFHVQPKIPPRNRPGGGTQGGSVQVKDPRGVVHTFPDQNSANNFKRAAGIN